MGRDKIEEFGGYGRKLQDCNSVHRINNEMFGCSCWKGDGSAVLAPVGGGNAVLLDLVVQHPAGHVQHPCVLLGKVVY